MHKLGELYKDYEDKCNKINEEYRQGLINLLSERGLLGAIVVNKELGCEGKLVVERTARIGSFEYVINFHRLTKNGTRSANPTRTLGPWFENDPFDDYEVKGQSKEEPDLELNGKDGGFDSCGSVFFDGKSYPVRRLNDGNGNVFIVGAESLEDVLFINDHWVSPEAREVDEGIAYYVPDDRINLKDDELFDYIVKNINGDLER